MGDTIIARKPGVAADREEGWFSGNPSGDGVEGRGGRRWYRYCVCIN